MIPSLQFLGALSAALFAGAALYINVVEHPARMGLETRLAAMQWAPSYKRARWLQAPLAIVGFLLGIIAWWQTGAWLWLLGALVLIANWPYTMLGIMPTNKKLMALDPASAGPDSRRLIEKWARLHAVRTALGFAATLIFVWALLH